MNITINRKDLLKALETIKPAILTRPPLLILGNVLLDVDDQYLTLTGTNLDLTIKARMAANVLTPGNCTVGFKQLLNQVKTIQAEYVGIERADNNLILTSSASRYVLLAGDVGEYPAVDMPVDAELGRVVLSDVVVSAAIKATQYVSSDRIHPMLHGVYFEFGATGATITATNGFWLTTYEVKDESIGTDTPINCIVPVPALNQLKKRKNMSWEFTIYGNKIVLATDDVWVMSKLIEGPYPNYRQAIPDPTKATLVTDRVELLRVVKSVLPCSEDTTHRVKFELGNRLTLSVENANTGMSGKETIEGVYSGEPMTVWYNGQFVAGILEHIQSDTVIWRTDGPKHVAVITPDDDEVGLYLLMPLCDTDI